MIRKASIKNILLQSISVLYKYMLNGSHCMLPLKKAARKFLSKETGLALRKGVPFPTGSIWGPLRAWLVIPEHHSVSPLIALAIHYCNHHFFSWEERHKVRDTINNRQDLVADRMTVEKNIEPSYFLFFLPNPSSHSISVKCIIISSSDFICQQKN